MVVQNKILVKLHSCKKRFYCNNMIKNNNFGSRNFLSIILQSNYRNRNEGCFVYRQRVLLYSSEDSDILDTFTENLVQEKSWKWCSIKNTESMYFSYKRFTSNKQNCDGNKFKVNLPKLDQNSVNRCLMKYVHNISEHHENLNNVLNRCIETKICPSRHILLAVASKFGRSGEKDGIKAIQQLCRQENEAEYINQAGYTHFLAEAMWVCGNTAQALELFSDVYKNHSALQRKVRHMVKYLIANVVTKKGEAALVLVTNFSKKFASQHGDFSFLSYLWESCFLSEWFVDNRTALELLRQYPELRDAVRNRVHIVAAVALQEHQVEVVHRLLELLLLYDMKKQYANVLQILFDYKCFQGDLQSCSAIIQSSLDLNVSLTSGQHKRFLSLLLDRRHKWLSKPKPDEPLSIPHFQMKF